jgi:hypothetical protein
MGQFIKPNAERAPPGCALSQSEINADILSALEFLLMAQAAEKPQRDYLEHVGAILLALRKRGH